jgi:hypothetical protein
MHALMPALNTVAMLPRTPTLSAVATLPATATLTAAALPATANSLHRCVPWLVAPGVRLTLVAVSLCCSWSWS